MQQYFKINGGNPLTGNIEIGGAKNSVLALMIASTLTSQVVTLEDVPEIDDVNVLIDILKFLGSNTIKAKQGKRNLLTIDNDLIEYKELEIAEVSKFRASYYLMGAMITRYKKCRLLFPGGCFLGPRPIDLHLKGLRKLGCTITEIDMENGDLILDVKVEDKLRGDRIFLDFPSVGATINIMLAAVMAEGDTIIENAAKEPEIVDVATLLSNMGAKIIGAGTDELKIVGVKKLHGCFHQVLPDRIEAGTYLMIGGLLGEDLTVSNVIPEHLDALISKLQDVGVILDIKDEEITVLGREDRLKPVNVKTGVFPSFATDLQQVLVTMLTQIDGESQVVETIYPERFRNCAYLNDMGANTVVTSSVESGKVVINGKTSLTGADVMATDLRAGAALVFAGLVANGETKVHNIPHVLRGYDSIVEKLTSVGADISLVIEES